MSKTMKKLLSIILAVLMIATTIPFAFAAGDGVPLTIDVTDVSWGDIGSEYDYYDEDGYILTGSSESVRVDVKESCNLTLQGVTLNELVTQYAPEESVINITLDGANEVTGFVAMFSEHLVFDGDETASFKAPFFAAGGSSGTVTVNGGNIIIDRVVDTSSSTIDCADFIINAGTVTASNNYYYVVNCPVKLNGGTLNIINTSAEYEAINDDITVQKGALLTVSGTYGLVHKSYDILMADGLAENNAFFVRYDTESEFVPVSDIKAALDGKTYAEIKIDAHEHDYSVGDTCVCGVCRLHESWTDGVCDTCGTICYHENYTNGECDVCGTSCKHENFADGVCDDCGTIAEEIKAGNTYTIDREKYMKFVPSVTGTYIISSTSTVDPRLYVYDSDLDELYNEDDSSYRDENSFDFYLEYEFTAGETYYFRFYDWNSDYDYTVILECKTHSGGEATCKVKAVCEACGQEYGDVAENAHDWSNLDGICANGCGKKCAHENETGETCTVCGAEPHTCDFSAEWKYDADKHWKECECGLTSEEGTHSFESGVCSICDYECPHESYTDGVCDNCEYACPHNWDTTKSEDNLTRPNDNVKGYYTYTCSICSDTMTEEVESANYTAYDAAVAKVDEYLADETITDEAKAYIVALIKASVNDYTDENGYLKRNLIASEQYVVTYAATEVNKLIAGIEEKIASGDIVKADYTEIDEAIAEIEQKLADENATEEAKAGLDEIKAQLEAMKADGNTSEADLAELEKALEEYEKALDEGIADGTAVKADYTEIDEAIAEIEQKLADENVTDEAKAGLEEIKEQLEEMKADDNTSEADLAELEKALEDYEAELDKGIADGTLVEVDGVGYFNELALNFESEMIEKYSDDWFDTITLTDETQSRWIEIGDYAESLEGTVAENAEALAKIKAELEALFAEFEKCIVGTHSFEYEVTSPAKCGVNAIETGICSVCGETDEREVEGSALEHIFLDYTSNDDATCTADGTKTAECVNGCGTEDTVTDEGTILDHVDKDGDKVCDECQDEIIDTCPDCGRPVHDDSFAQNLICLIIMLINLIKKMF